jgi:hypothetical protein
MKKQFYRSGDHNFHQVNKIPKAGGATGEIIKHDGRFIFGVGEASNHNHVITVKRLQDMIITKTKDGGFYFDLKEDGELWHVLGDSLQVADHKPITIKKGIYFQVHEREQEIFSKCVRKVVD